MSLKKVFTLVLCGVVAFFISSCKTYKESLSVASNNPLGYKLPAMNVVYKNSNRVGRGQGFAQPMGLMSSGRHILFNEIQTNCLEDLKDSISGTVEIELTYGTIKSNFGLPLLSGFTILSLNLLGMPLTITKMETDVRINIYNAENTLIKSYKYHKKKSAPVALYYGSSATYLQYAIGKYFAEQFKADLERDAAALAPYLTEKSYYPMGNNAGRHILKAQDFCLDHHYKKALKELDEARASDDLNEFNERALDEVYEVARAGRDEQLQQNAQTWAAIGTAVAVAGAATAVAVASNKSKSSSVGSVSQAASKGAVSTSSSSSSGNNEDESSSTREKQKVMKECIVCNGTGKLPDWNLSEGTGSLTYCNECKAETNPKHRHIKCKSCKGTGEVFDKYK